MSIFAPSELMEESLINFAKQCKFFFQIFAQKKSDLCKQNEKK